MIVQNRLPMWAYWRDKKGLREAIDQYPEAKKDPVIAAAIADYERAYAALDALMTQHDERAIYDDD